MWGVGEGGSVLAKGTSKSKELVGKKRADE